MGNPVQEKFVAKLLAFILAGVTVFVVSQSVTDPVNVTKLFLLGGLACAVFGACILGNGFNKILSNRILLTILGLFFVASLASLIASSAPLSQSIYGAYGRNNGFLLYLFLIMCFVATLTLEAQKNFRYLIIALLLAGLVNIAYGYWVISFGDFIGWNNIYGNLLGTLGNPNFIGSFFGMFSGLLFAYLFASTLQLKYRIAAAVLLFMVFFGIVETHAVQGKVLYVASFVMTLFFYVRSRTNNSKVDLIYICLSATGFIFALLGTLQKGPLSDFLYKETVSLRGQYWFAGWKTGLENPIFGVGFDSFGDWYRRSRRESALTLPGVDTVTNASHNVYLDIFAFGGWPLFLAYISISLYILNVIFKHTLKFRKFDPVFVTLTSVWVCYQLQSIISINQIGLAVWGWIYGAAIVAYCKSGQGNLSESETSKRSNRPRVSKASSQVISPQLTGGICCIIGFLVSVPPLSADMKWRDAQTSQNVQKVESTLITSYMNPPNTFKYAQIVGVFESNGFSDLAHKYALQSVKFNPDSFELWRNLSLLKKTSQSEKNEALRNMKRLDPLNPNLGVASN